MFLTAPFTRALGLLRRHPAVLAAVIGAASIAGLVAASTPLFLSSAASAALERELAGRCPSSIAAHIPVFADIEESRSRLDDIAQQHPLLGATTLTVEGTYVQVSKSDTANGLALGSRFFIRDGATAHLEVVATSGEPGVWIGERAATQLGVVPGDTIEVTGGRPGGFTIGVAGVYADLDDRLADPYWCSVERLIEPNAMGDVPPPLLIVDAEHFDLSSEIYSALFASYSSVPGWWELEVLTEGMTASAARDLVERLGTFEADLRAWAGEQVGTDHGSPFRAVRIASDLEIVVTRVEALSKALDSSVRPLALVVVLIALGLVSGAGRYWVERRRHELVMLLVRGVPPGLLALKAVLEMLLPLVIGTVAGWAIATALAPAVGPSSVIEPSARRVAALVSLLGGLAGLSAVALTVRRQTSSLLAGGVRRQRRRQLRVPLAVASSAAALTVRLVLGDEVVMVGERELVGSLDPMVMLFPLFLFSAAVLFTVELLYRLLPRVQNSGGRLGAAPYLASRRIASAPSVVAVLIAATAFPTATLIYSSTLTRSATSTVDAKGKTFVGSDVAVPLSGNYEVPDSLAGSATPVLRLPRVQWADEQVDIVAIDPATFTDGAFWDASFASEPIESLLARLSEPPGSSLPALVVNSETRQGVLRQGDFEVPLESIGHLVAFPSMHPVRPTVIVNRGHLLQRIDEHSRPVRGARYYLWVAGMAPDAVSSALRAAEVGFAFTVVADRTLNQIKYQSVIWTFDLLEIFAVLAGLIVVAATLLYSDTRQRTRNLSYALARRMGLSRRQHLAAGFLELTALVGAGIALGLITARFGALSVYRILDPIPGTPPGPSWVGATDVIVWTVVAGLILAGGTAWLAQRTADAADPAEMLRHDE